jgi:hypothetical protein
VAQGQPRVYRIAIQYEMPAVYKVRVSCDNGSNREYVSEYFAETDHVTINAEAPDRIADAVVAKIIMMFRN